MKPKLNLPTGSGSLVWPDKMNPDKIIKAEARCLIYSEQLEDGSSAVMKMYYRRGFANFIRGKIFNYRAQREYRILNHLASCEIPCSIPLLWTSGYCKDYGFMTYFAPVLFRTPYPWRPFCLQARKMFKTSILDLYFNCYTICINAAFIMVP